MTKHHQTARLALLPALAVVAVLAAGCGGSSSSDDAAGSPTDHSTMDMSTAPSSAAPSPSASSPATAGDATSAVTLTIKDFAYSGADKVAPGATITVMNEDSVAHTVTADSDGGFDVNVPAGGKATFKAPTKPGDYAYHCTYHGNMHGSLTVG